MYTGPWFSTLNRCSTNWDIRRWLLNWSDYHKGKNWSQYQCIMLQTKKHQNIIELCKKLDAPQVQCICLVSQITEIDCSLFVFQLVRNFAYLLQTVLECWISSGISNRISQFRIASCWRGIQFTQGSKADYQLSILNFIICHWFQKYNWWSKHKVS